MSPIFAYAAELYATMRADFELTIEAAYQAAEKQTGGAILNRQGRAEGIDPYSLMTGPWSRVVKYGAPELVQWAEDFGRPSVTQFEREWFTAWLGEEPLPDAPVDSSVVIDGVDMSAVLYPEAPRVPEPVVQLGSPVQFKLEAPDEWPPYVVWPGLRFATVTAIHGEEHPAVPDGEFRYYLHDSMGGEMLCPESWFVPARSSADC